MGQRVAKLVPPYDDDGRVGWIVYQSTAMACFDPIFRTQLEAELFARRLTAKFPAWSSKEQETYRSEICRFVRGKFGEDPESSDAYWDALAGEEIKEEFDRWLASKKRSAQPRP